MCSIRTSFSSSPEKANVILHSATFRALFNFQEIGQIEPYILLPNLIGNSVLFNVLKNFDIFFTDLY